MTAHLIDPAAVAAIQARRADQPAPRYDLTEARAARLTDRQRVTAMADAFTLLGRVFDDLTTESKAQRDAWQDMAVQVSSHTLNLTLYAAQVFASTHADPRRAVRLKARESVTSVREAIRTVLEGFAQEAEAGLRAEAEAAANAVIEEERALLTHAADQAQLDATEARRQLDAASAQLTREREAHAHEVAQLRDQLTRERQVVIDRDRETRNRIQQLEHDLAEGRKVLAHLNAECQRLEDQLTAPPALPTPQEAPMPEPTPTPGPSNALETASLCAFLRGRHEKAYRWAGTALFSPETYTTPERVTDPNILTAWRNAYPTPASMQAQLRALVLPIVGRAA